MVPKDRTLRGASVQKLSREFELAASLRACGHFLYYQTGGKAGQRRILVTLLKSGDLTQKELQETLDVSSGALSEILQKMEEAALVVRKKSPGDKRQVKIALTLEGESMARSADEHYARTLERMFECLDAGEAERLGETLNKLAKHLDTLKADPLLTAGAEGAKTGVPR